VAVQVGRPRPYRRQHLLFVPVPFEILADLSSLFSRVRLNSFPPPNRREDFTKLLFFCSNRAIFALRGPPFGLLRWRLLFPFFLNLSHALR